jgi:hypothetical protein
MAWRKEGITQSSHCRKTIDGLICIKPYTLHTYTARINKFSKAAENKMNNNNKKKKTVEFNQSRAWWHASIIPVMQEALGSKAEVEGTYYLKNN